MKFVIVGLLLVAQTIDAAEPFQWRWRLGGDGLYRSSGGAAEDIPQRLRNTVSLFGAGTCSKFDAKTNILKMLRTPEQHIITMNDIPGRTLANLPGYVTCRAKPGLCQLAQENIARLTELFSRHVRSCLATTSEVTARDNPYSAWLTVAAAEAWYEGSKQGNVVESQVAANTQRNAGIHWIGGEFAGGRQQRQIRPLRQIAAAGWCLSQGKKVGCQRGDPESIYAEFWETPAAFKAWVTSVLGDIGLWVYERAPPPEVLSGYGLEPKLQQYQDAVAEKLRQVLAKSRGSVTQQDLYDLSTRDSRLSLRVVEALERHPQRRWLQRNLTNRIALGQLVDRALAAKHLLLTGAQDPNVQRIDAAHKLLRRSLQNLDDEIYWLLHGSHLRNKLLGEISDFVLRDQTKISPQRRAPFEKQ